MDAIASNVGSALGVKPKPKTFVEQIQHYLKELFEEILIYIGKFKAWLTPGTADDQAMAAADKGEDMVDSLKAKFQ